MGDWREGAEIMLRCATNGNDNAPPGDSAYGFILSLGSLRRKIGTDLRRLILGEMERLHGVISIVHLGMTKLEGNTFSVMMMGLNNVIALLQ